MSESILIKLFAFIFGGLWGSFANVLIYRIPREINIAIPRSFCPNCKNKIPFWANVPIFSFLYLRGKCKSCGAKIELYHFFVELLTASMAVLLLPSIFSQPYLIKYFILFFIFVIFISHTFIDLKFYILPDSLNLVLLILISIYALLYLDLVSSLIGLGVGIIVPTLVTYIFYLMKGQIGLGGGDIKLFGILGIFFGPLGILKCIFLSCFLGSIIGLTLLLLKKIKKDEPIPFGPYIILSASIQIYFPHQFQTISNFFIIS